MTRESIIRRLLLRLGQSRASTIVRKDIIGLARQREKKFLVITTIGQGSTFITACVDGVVTGFPVTAAPDTIFDFGILQQRMHTSTQVIMRSTK